MHAHVHPSPAQASLYEQLEALPEGLIGEILDGQLHTQPRPTGIHALAAAGVSGELYGPFQRGRGGPGGWWILPEPELHFLRDTEVDVPDLAGWRRERMPQVPAGHRFEIVPDWVCEILSPSTASKDREIKLPIYARYGVPCAWLIDPAARRIEAYRLVNGAWQDAGTFTGDQPRRIPPFDAVAIDLAALWGA
jgi:Uma2 family endonuclease